MLPVVHLGKCWIFDWIRPMRTLIPAENWDYSLKDLVEGLGSVLKRDEKDPVINIAKVGPCIPIRSGRAAIVAAIQTLKLGPQARIGVPLYSCPVVFKAVLKAGCRPVFIDIEKETYCISPMDLSRKNKYIDAVIVIHMFGNLCDMAEVIKSAHGKPIIEDCAQSLGSRSKQMMSGTMGDIGIFSFRSGKYLSVGEGGALYAKDRAIYSRLRSIVAAMESPSKNEELVHIIKTYLRSKLRSRPLFGLIGAKIWTIYNQTTDHTAKTPILMGKIFIHDLQLARRRLVVFEKFLAAHRENTEYFFNNLLLSSALPCHEIPPNFSNRYAFPIAFTTAEERDAMARYLFQKKIHTIKPYQDIVELASAYYGYTGDCPGAEKVAKTTLLLPNHSRLRKQELRYICESFNSGWKEIREQQPDTEVR